MKPASLGFWVDGGKHAPREAVNAARAFAGFAACDARLKLDREHYLSAFTYGEEFLAYTAKHGTTKGYGGPCSAAHLWFDIDRADDIEAALADTRALAIHLGDQWSVPEDLLLIFMSGNKGFHIGVPTALWTPAPSVTFNLVAKKLASTIAAGAGGRGVVIDPLLYDKVRLLRAPNSRHAKTGLYKVRLTPDELMGLSIEAIVERARAPYPFDVPEVRRGSDALCAGWEQAEREVVAEREAMSQRHAAIKAAGGPTRLNDLTLEFIRDGAPKGGPDTPPEAGRHNRLYTAALNLGEFGCPPSLAHALLTDAGLDCGISPSEVRRTIDNGLNKTGGGPRA